MEPDDQFYTSDELLNESVYQWFNLMLNEDSIRFSESSSANLTSESSTDTMDDTTTISSTSSSSSISTSSSSSSSSTSTSGSRFHPNNVDIIDLSNVESPIRINAPSHIEDDVEIVASNLPPIIDLCSPATMNVAPANRTNRINAIFQRNNGGSQNTPRRRNEPLSLPVLHTRNSNSLQSSSDSNSRANRKRKHQASAKDIPSTSTTSQDTYVCPICYESPFLKNPTTTSCGHVFCNSCITTCVDTQKRCPMCMTKLTHKKLLRIFMS